MVHITATALAAPTNRVRTIIPKATSRTIAKRSYYKDMSALMPGISAVTSMIIAESSASTPPKRKDLLYTTKARPPQIHTIIWFYI